MVNEQDYVELGLFCAGICKALKRGIGEKKLDELSKSVCDAINQLTAWVQPAVRIRFFVDDTPDRRTVEEIQKEVKKRSESGRFTRFFHSRNDKDVIAGWNSDLNKLLQVFNVCLTCLLFGHN